MTYVNALVFVNLYFYVDSYDYMRIAITINNYSLRHLVIDGFGCIGMDSLCQAPTHRHVLDIA